MKDRTRIELSLISALIETAVYMHLTSIPEDAPNYKRTLEITAQSIFFNGVTRERQQQLSRRLKRIGNKIIAHIKVCEFDSCMLFLAVTEWVRLLIDENLLEINISWPLAELLKDLDELTLNGKKYREDFEEVNNKAIAQVLTIHDIAQKEGYFLKNMEDNING